MSRPAHLFPFALLRRTALLLIGLFLLAACGQAESPMLGSCTLPIDQNAPDTEKITALLRAEGELVVAQDIEALMALWAQGGEVVDAKHTPDDTEDDQRWMDLDAVRHRYVRIVFPGNPQPSDSPELAIAIGGNSANVIATTRIGDEVAPGGDLWHVVKEGNCWAIARLSYNNEE